MQQADALESEHQMFAGLCIAAKPERFNALTECVTDVLQTLPPEVSAKPVRDGEATSNSDHS